MVCVKGVASPEDGGHAENRFTQVGNRDTRFGGCDDIPIKMSWRMARRVPGTAGEMAKSWTRLEGRGLSDGLYAEHENEEKPKESKTLVLSTGKMEWLLAN